jgi:hypothetical protein
MRFASRTDSYMGKFVSHASILNDRLQYFFGRKLYCDIVNPTPHPENQIFFLRPAKQSELDRLDSRLVEGEQISALNELKILTKLALPKSIADFRIVPSKQNSSEAFLVNLRGERSEPRQLDYFRPKAHLTMVKRCLNLGNFCWSGSDAMIEPFHKFCLGSNL